MSTVGVDKLVRDSVALRRRVAELEQAIRGLRVILQECGGELAAEDVARILRDLLPEEK